jgi:hypothetical protein
VNFTLSDQQQTIIDTIMRVPQVPHITVNAVAGASKTHTMMVAATKLLERNSATKIKVLVYGKANQLDIKQALPKQVDVTTVHAMAYQHTVQPLKLKLPIRDSIRASDVPSYLDINRTTLAVSINFVELFLSSDSVSPKEFATTLLEPVTDTVLTDAITILNYMEKGKINITHQFYLKLFHIKVLNGTINIDPVDVLMVEEAQDLTQVMVDVAEKYPATQKIYSGDSAQAILQFAGSVDVLSKYKHTSTVLPLTQSFRVNTDDAQVIQSFMQTNVTSDFEFTGFDRPYPDKPTFAYLTRTNAALIDKMIELDRVGTPFKLSTKSKLAQMFSLPLTLATLKPNGEQINSDMQYLQDTADFYYRTPDLASKFPTLFGYLRYTYAANSTITQAMDLVAKHGAKVLFGIYKSAKVHMKSDANLTIATVHTSKGLTYTEVELDPSCDKALAKVLLKPIDDRTADDIAEIYLFYVAASRHTHILKGSAIFDDCKQQLERN